MKRIHGLYLLTVILIGAASFQMNWFPKPQLVQLKKYLFPEYPVVRIYSPGTPVFSNRNYTDTTGTTLLNGTYLIAPPRHHYASIDFEVNQSVKIYRLLTEVNDNSPFEDWEKTDIPIYVEGRSCIHSYLVAKDFDAGIISLTPGGPKASSPIFVKSNTNEQEKFKLTLFRHE